MKRDRGPLIIGILILVIVVLAVFMAYMFLIKPAFTGYVLDKQVQTYNQGVADTINFMLSEIQQKGYTQITVGEQTMFLAPVQMQPPA